MSKKVIFQVTAEVAGEATTGLLLGDFNQWNHEAGFPLKKQKDGSLKVTAELEPGEYQYRYFLNDGRWVNDGNAHGYAHDGKYGIENCVIIVEAEAEKVTAKVAKIEKAAPPVATETVKTAKKPAAKNAPVEAPAKAPAKAAKKAPAKAIPAKVAPAKKEVAAKPVAKKTAIAKAEVKKTVAKPITPAKKTTKKTK